MRAASALLKQNVGSYASMITAEMGKPINEARAEVCSSMTALLQLHPRPVGAEVHNRVRVLRRQCSSVPGARADQHGRVITADRPNVASLHFEYCAGLVAPARSYVTFNPLGVVLIIMPWNFPFWQVNPQPPPGRACAQEPKAQAECAALGVREMSWRFLFGDRFSGKRRLRSLPETPCC